MQRQHIPDDLVQPLLEYLSQSSPLLLVGELRVERVHIRGQTPLAPKVIPRILESWQNPLATASQPGGHRVNELFGPLLIEPIVLLFIGKQGVVDPDGLAVLAPITPKCPAWQRFARIPFSLSVMQERARGEAAFEPLDQIVGNPSLCRPHCQR